MTWSEPCLALAPLPGLVADCVTHLAYCWWSKGQRRTLSLALALAVGLALTLTITAIALSGMNVELTDALAMLLLNAVSYFALGYGYYNFVNLNFTSLRIRLLQEVLLAQDGLSLDDVQRRYGTAEMVERRLERLQSSGQLVERDGRFHLGKRTLLVVARLNDIVRFLVLGTTVAPAQARSTPLALPPAHLRVTHHDEALPVQK